MFEDELELAYAVINGIEAEGKKGNYSTKRIKFSSEPPIYLANTRVRSPDGEDSRNKSQIDRYFVPLET